MLAFNEPQYHISLYPYKGIHKLCLPITLDPTYLFKSHSAKTLCHFEFSTWQSDPVSKLVPLDLSNLEAMTYKFINELWDKVREKTNYDNLF